MTYNPDTLRLLGAYWTEQGGVNLGVVGDTNHTSGYHLGRDRIYDGAGPGQGDNDYSVRHPRDKAGLSNAASAIDLGKLNGSYDQLYKFSEWLAQQIAARAPGAEDIREVIYSPDGQQVQRMSGIDGQIHTGAGNGDLSHRTHTHISYFRDSEERDKTALFARYFEMEDEPMVDWYPLPGGDGTIRLKTDRPRGLLNLVTGKVEISDDLEKTSHCRGHLVKSFGEGAGRQEGYVVRHEQQAHLALDDVVESFEPATPTAPAPGPHSHTVVTTVDGQKVEGTVTLP